MSTEVILTTTVDKLGAEGDTVRVADGYARNYLIPKGLAMPASPANLRRVETLRKKREEQRLAELGRSKELAARLAKQSFTITAPAGPDERLYGSVTAATISEALKREGLEVDRKKILLEHPIRATGVYDIDVRLDAEVSAKVKIWVVAGEEEAPPAATPPAEQPTEKGKKTSRKK